jgi:signal transduction histidine kinase
VSPGALLEEVIGELQPIAATQGVTLHLLNETDLVVPGDEGLLSRVFYNLIENGINYTPTGGSVTIAVTRREQWAVITVTDTGIGIAAADLPHIFERFYRVEASRSRHCGGAGLGLSIVSALVRQHHGKIEVESAPGQGSTFTVLLPLHNSPGEDTPGMSC